MKTLYLIHHSHTDIGYTHNQTTVRRFHIGYIRQALAILEQRGLDNGFRWVCESFWGVEQFLMVADEQERVRFASAVKAGAIGLSANYANFSELLCEEVLSRLIARGTAYGQSIGQPVESAMTADINGFGWGFCRALQGNGVNNLFTCIHTHHGMYPLQLHRPFNWSGPDGRQLLVWNGEHYHLGNELGLAPGAVSSYNIKDECDAHTIYHDPWRVAEIRIPRLFEQLEQDGYPYDFLPVMISGLRSDNAPPSAAIHDQVNRWNDVHGREIQVEMVTLDQFFTRLRAEEIEIPVYSGDWPDWWTDGVASMPASTALFREAQRNWRVVRKLYQSSGRAPVSAVSEKLCDNLALYAEHTYGHASSIVEPYHPLVRSLAERKRAYAAIAQEEAQTLLEVELTHRGMVEHRPGLPLHYRVINPHPVRVTEVAHLQIEHYEYYENHVYRGVEVIDEADGKSLAAGIDPTPVTTTILVPLTLQAGEEKTLRILPTMTREFTPDEGRPALVTRQREEQAGQFETDAFRIEWQLPEGITCWLSKSTGEDLLRDDRDHPPFIPISSQTPMPDSQDAWSVRGALGLSRSGADARWSVGKVVAVREHYSGGTPGDPLEDQREDQTVPMYHSLEFDIEVAGCRECTLVLTATAGLPRVDLTLKVNKENCWAPENLYLSLPFGSGARDTIWLDKAGGAVCARVDQLPGTLIDYYSLQDGFVSQSGKGMIAVTMMDSPLLQLGPLEYRKEHIQHKTDQPCPDQALPYAWLMTNYWETNFAAGLGGFHSFRFSVFQPDAAEPDALIRQLQVANDGLVCFRLSDDS